MNQKSGHDLKIQLQYLANDEDLATYIASAGGEDIVPHHGNYIMHEVTIENGRLCNPPTSLDIEGFQLIKHHTRISDFYNDEIIEREYAPEVEQLVQSVTGATRVVVFDHTRRATTDAIRKQRMIREHALTIHNDYTEFSAAKRLREILPNEADTLLRRRFAIVNLWRPSNGPIRNFPLALCDASSVNIDNLIPVKRQAKDRIGELQFATYHPNHKWVYFPDMQMDETLIFKTFDSSTDGRARFTIHTSFDDPNAEADSLERESIDSRCFIFF